MADRAEAARVTVNRHVIRWVGEDHRGPLFAHQRSVGGGIEGIVAQDTMTPEDPRISDLADCRARRNIGCRIARIVSPVRDTLE